MALTIENGEEADMALYAVTERLYATEDGRAVPEGDPDAKWLLCVPGQQIRYDVAVAKGIVDAEDDFSRPKELESFAVGHPNLDELKKAELVDLCEQYGLPTGGNKPDLIARLDDYFVPFGGAAEDDEAHDGAGD